MSLPASLSGSLFRSPSGSLSVWADTHMSLFFPLSICLCKVLGLYRTLLRSLSGSVSGSVSGLVMESVRCYFVLCQCQFSET